MAGSNALYQLEVKLPSGSNGETRTQVVKLKGEEDLKFSTRLEFPNVGDSSKLYIAINENKIYRWDNGSATYYCVGSDYNDIKTIDCGGANDDSSVKTED